LRVGSVLLIASKTFGCALREKIFRAPECTNHKKDFSVEEIAVQRHDPVVGGF
jgi:hypothetical protein